MNERIEKLALECYQAPEFDYKKFAESIVRECMECSDPLVSHYINTHTENEQALLLAAVADYSSEIKKHFGVEE